MTNLLNIHMHMPNIITSIRIIVSFISQPTYIHVHVQWIQTITEFLCKVHNIILYDMDTKQVDLMKV